MKRSMVKETVLSKDIFGSIVGEEYSGDGLVELRDFLNERIEAIPPEYLDSARVRIDSVGGYEGEHHSEIEIYYERPEMDEEYAARKAKEKANADELKRHELMMLAKLKYKYEADKNPKA